MRPARRTVRLLSASFRYLSAWQSYKQLPGAEPLRVRDRYPCPFDANPTAPYDAHYFHQAVWAMERIVRCGPQRHVDVASDIQFVGMLTTHVPVTFVDLRLLTARLPRLACVAADLLALPFADESLQSLSCLHVAEHVGLGRYGDTLNPFGTRQACLELTRVLAPRGNLFFSVPVGMPRVCFNAHRIHTPEQILSYFSNLELVEFSAVDDHGELLTDVACEQIENATYGCGLFWFRRRHSLT